MDGSTLFSEEGITQGDPLAMPMYAMASIPLINHLRNVEDLKQVWYADDTSAVGSLHSTRQWWDHNGSGLWIFCQCHQDMAIHEREVSFSKTHKLTSLPMADPT